MFVTQLVYKWLVEPDVSKYDIGETCSNSGKPIKKAGCGYMVSHAKWEPRDRELNPETESSRTDQVPSLLRGLLNIELEI